MKRWGLVAVFLGLLISGSCAQTISPNFWSMGVNNLTSTGVPPLYLKAYRPSSECGWSAIETSNGVYNWAACDSVVAYATSHGLKVWWTLLGVPGWANGNASAGTPPTNFNDLYTFVTAFAGRYACQISYAEEWNEMSPGSTWWLGTAAQMATITQNIYPILHTACPSTVILSPSVTFGSGSSAFGQAVSAGAFWDTYLSSCNGYTCFDQINFHAYSTMQVSAGSGGNGVYVFSVMSQAPELTADIIPEMAQIDAAHGFSSSQNALYSSEGYPWITHTCTSNAAYSYDTPLGASLTSRFLLLTSVLKASNYYSYNDTGCVNSYGTLIGTNAGLNQGGWGFKNTQTWLLDATWTSPPARVQGTNLIRTAPNGSGVATGLLAGVGGCSGAPSGTGHLPTYWSAYLQHAAAGMSAYVVGSGTDGNGINYIDVRLCGSDTTAGTGTGGLSLSLESNAQLPMNYEQNYVLGAYTAMSAGSSANMAEIDFLTTESTSGGSYLRNDCVYNQHWPTSAALNLQYQEIRCMGSYSPSAYMSPEIKLTYFYNGSSPLAVDYTIRIGNPVVDESSFVWLGTFTKSNGFQGEVVWDASNTGTAYTVPSNYVYAADATGKTISLSNGAIALYQTPIFLTNQQQAVVPCAVPTFYDGFSGQFFPSPSYTPKTTGFIYGLDEQTLYVTFANGSMTGFTSVPNALVGQFNYTLNPDAFYTSQILGTYTKSYSCGTVPLG